MNYYTGIGSRRTPIEISVLMTKIALKLSNTGLWTVRSGGAAGADAAFEIGTALSGLIEIYRPKHATPEALKMAESVHPAWNRCSDYAKQLHARNCFQVLGPSLDSPSKYVICWTPDGAEHRHETSINTGGTGQAIRIASLYKVPVFNMANSARLNKFVRWLNA